MNDGIYSTVPEKNIIKGFERDRIMAFLSNNKGNGRLFTARELAEKCNFPMTSTNVEVRKAITELITIDLQPIVALKGRGFKIADTPGEILEYKDSLEKRVKGILRKIRGLRAIYEVINSEKDNRV